MIIPAIRRTVKRVNISALTIERIEELFILFHHPLNISLPINPPAMIITTAEIGFSVIDAPRDQLIAAEIMKEKILTIVKKHPSLVSLSMGIF